MAKDFFTKLPHAVMRRRDLSPGAKMLLAVLMDYAEINERGIAWPGIDRLADELGMSRRGVIGASAALVTAGLIEVTPGKGRATTRYRPCSSALSAPQRRAGEDGVVVQKVHVSSAESAPQGRRSSAESAPNQEELTKNSDQEELAVACAPAPARPSCRPQPNGAEPDTSTKPPGRRRARQRVANQAAALGSEATFSNRPGDGPAPERQGPTPRDRALEQAVPAGVAPGAGPPVDDSSTTPPDGQGSLLSDLAAETPKRANNRPSVQPASPVGSQRKAKAKGTTRKRKPRKRDELWDALVKAWWRKEMPPSHRTRVARTVRDLRAMGATPDEIKKRVPALRQLTKERDWGVAGLEALVKWWDELENANARKDRPGRVAAEAGKYDNLQIIDA